MTVIDATQRRWNFGRLADLKVEGPWTNEPDKIQWVDPATSLDCLMVRNRSGVWCGYVGVPADHPWYGKEYDDVDVEIHGGLTFAARCQPREDNDGICHVPFVGRSDDVWWLGFDTAHAGDLCPLYDLGDGPLAELRSKHPEFRGTYRDEAYVKRECADLARQVHAAA